MRRRQINFLRASGGLMTFYFSGVSCGHTFFYNDYFLSRLSNSQRSKKIWCNHAALQVKVTPPLDSSYDPNTLFFLYISCMCQRNRGTHITIVKENCFQTYFCNTFKQEPLQIFWKVQITPKSFRSSWVKKCCSTEEQIGYKMCGSCFLFLPLQPHHLICCHLVTFVWKSQV